MKISKQARRDAKTLFRSCLQDHVPQESRVRQVVDLLISKKPRGYAGILNRLVHLVKTDIANRTATVQSAVPLDDSTQADIRRQVATQYGENILLSFETNTELIGGLRVQVGSDVYDGTLKGRLQTLEAHFQGA